jgi:hypothetical protein
MTLPEFSKVFAVLAIQLGKSDADEATIRSYYQALRDLDVELVAMAAESMAKRGGAQEGESRHWFPKTSEWRTVVEKIDTDRSDALKARLRKLPEPLCNACNDTGFARDEAKNRVTACDCRKLRRLEVLGRRPMPALPAGPESA